MHERCGKRFRLDAAASLENAHCKKFYTVNDNGLQQPWANATFCNPPFARFGDWIKKAAEEAWNRAIYSCIVGPNGCSQYWFHVFASRFTTLIPTQRISFYDSTTGEPTRGADRDTMIYLLGPKFNVGSKGRPHIEPLDVKGEVITAGNCHKFPRDQW
jgi:site-specific DNA-methyltransferase (adenine-specific)